MNAPPSVRPHPPGTAPPPPQPHLEARFQPWTSRFPRGLLLVLVHISAGAVAALERCVWALPMGHGEPPCPLTSAVGDVRPRAPLNAPGAGSAGDSTWLLTWPCPPETWCCPGQLTPGALARPLPSWPRLLRSHPFRTQTAKTTNPNPAPGSRSALLPGLRGVRFAARPPLLQSPDSEGRGGLRLLNGPGLLSLSALPWAELSKVPEPPPHAPLWAGASLTWCPVEGAHTW